MDSYTIEYTASVRSCSRVMTQNGSTVLDGSSRMTSIRDIEEDSIVTVNLTAVNTGGTASAVLSKFTSISSQWRLRVGARGARALPLFSSLGLTPLTF